MSKLDLHYYDGKIVHNEMLDRELDRVSRLATEEKKVAFSRLRELIANRSEPSLVSYDTIVRDFTVQRGGPNYDTSNDLYACDLLYLCYEFIILKGNNDMLSELILQLNDMCNGMCNPGRTTRLYQIVNAFMS